MRKQVLVKKYAQGMARALKDEEEFMAVNRELAEFARLRLESRELGNALASPFLPARKKIQIVEAILRTFRFTDKTTRFLLLLMEHNRLDLLSDILRVLPALWQESRGVLTFEVSSAVPLAEIQKQRLKSQLERLEKRPVYLQYQIDPGLVAGLSVRKGNVVYDASLKGHLTKLKEKISEG